MSDYGPRRKVVIGRYWNRPKAKLYDCNARDAERMFQESLKQYEQSKREARAYTDIRDTNIARKSATLEEECPIRAPAGRRARSAVRDRESFLDRRKEGYVNTFDDLNPTLMSPNLYMASKKGESLRSAMEETKTKNIGYENDPAYYKSEKSTNYTLRTEPTPAYDGLDSRLSETRHFSTVSSDVPNSRSSLGPRDRDNVDDSSINADQLSSNYRDRLARLREELGLPDLGLERDTSSSSAAATSATKISSTVKSSAAANDLDRSSPVRTTTRTTTTSEGPRKRAPYSPYNVTDRTLRAHGLTGPSADELPDFVDNAELPELKMNFPSSKEILERIKAIEDDL